MTDDPLTIRTDEDLDTCRALTRRHGFLHLPVCHENTRWAGLARNILLHDSNQNDDEVRTMRASLHSMPDA